MNLFRVQNNELFIDWPWGRERIREYLEAKPPNNGSTPFRIDRRKMHNYWLMQNTLRMVTVNDSIFMMGGEQPVLPWLLPFPSFMFAPKLGHSEMPFPWPQSFRDELAIYRRAMNEHDELIKSHPETYNNHHHLNYSDEFYMKQAQQKPWNEKIPKAAFYSTYDFLRRVVWDQAALRPGDPPVVALAIYYPSPFPHNPLPCQLHLSLTHPHLYSPRFNRSSFVFGHGLEILYFLECQIPRAQRTAFR